MKKKLSAVAALAALALALGAGAAGCSIAQNSSSSSETDEKRDVVFVIGDDEGKKFEFPAGTETVRASRSYDGQAHAYEVKCRYEDADEVFTPARGALSFSWTYTAPDGAEETYLSKVKDTGEYCLSVAAAASPSWNYREIKFYLSVERPAVVLKPDEKDILFEVPALKAAESAEFLYTADREETLYLASPTNACEITLSRGGEPCTSARTGGYLALPVERGNTYSIKFTNTDRGALPEVACTLIRPTELTPGEESENFRLDGKKLISFRVPLAGKYELSGVPSDVTGGVLGTEGDLSKGVYLEAGEYAAELEGNMPQMTCRLWFSSETLPYVGVRTAFTGGEKSVLFKFVPRLSAKYTIGCEDAKLTHLMKGEEMTEYVSDGNPALTEGETYYFRFESTLSAPQAVYYAEIGLETVASLTIDKDRGYGETEVSGEGEVFVSVDVAKEGRYAVTGVSGYAVYTARLDRMDAASALGTGKYYLKVSLSAGKACRLQMQAGTPVKAGSSIGLTHSEMFKCELEEGAEYVVTIRKGAVAAFTAAIVLWDTQGNRYEPAKEESAAGVTYYTFTARDRVTYIDVIMINGDGQVGAFQVTKKAAAIA